MKIIKDTKKYYKKLPLQERLGEKLDTWVASC
jgi:hypothetical protein